MALPNLPGAAADVVAIFQHQRGLRGANRKSLGRDVVSRLTERKEQLKGINVNILVVFGTRPEAIKLFPVIHALKNDPQFKVTVCVTAQHRELLDQVLAVAQITPDIDLDIMKANQSLPEMTTRMLIALDRVIGDLKPDRVLVQGDTTTAMVTALTAFYRKIPVDHVEAGLRSGDIYAPWPEEINRKIVSTIASLHFAPTERAADALVRENVAGERIFITGNTVIDALIQTLDRIDEFADVQASIDRDLFDHGSGRRVILVTAHRRENFDGGMQRIANALEMLAERNDTLIVFPIHPNPNVLNPMREALQGNPHIRLLPPVDYVPFVYLLSRCDLALTDSGGVQEEAPALGKPVLIMRETTERPEGIEAGTARLVGTDSERIFIEASRLLDERQHYERMSLAHNPFGDGQASRRILNILSRERLRGLGDEYALNRQLLEGLPHAS
jgi:UDP-N-acetylglucosamine 2-epimerase (non-hydrolysing)